MLDLEKKFIRDVIESGKPVLGICLAPNSSRARWEPRYTKPGKEIGWFPVYGVTSNSFRYSASSINGSVPLARGNLRPTTGAALSHVAKVVKTKRFNSGRQLSDCSFISKPHHSRTRYCFSCRDELIHRNTCNGKDILSVKPERYDSINLIDGQCSFFPASEQRLTIASTQTAKAVRFAMHFGENNVRFISCYGTIEVKIEAQCNDLDELLCSDVGLLPESS